MISEYELKKPRYHSKFEEKSLNHHEIDDRSSRNIFYFHINDG